MEERKPGGERARNIFTEERGGEKASSPKAVLGKRENFQREGEPSSQHLSEDKPFRRDAEVEVLRPFQGSLQGNFGSFDERLMDGRKTSAETFEPQDKGTAFTNRKAGQDKTSSSFSEDIPLQKGDRRKPDLMAGKEMREEKLKKKEAPGFIPEGTGNIDPDIAKALKKTKLERKTDAVTFTAKGLIRYEKREADEINTGRETDKTFLSDMTGLELKREVKSSFRRRSGGKTPLSRADKEAIDKKAREIWKERHRDERFTGGKAKGIEEIKKDTPFKTEKFAGVKEDRFTKNSLAKLRGRPEKKEEKELKAIKKKLTKKHRKSLAKTAKAVSKKERAVRLIKAAVRHKPLITALIGGAMLLLVPLFTIMFIEAAANTMFSTIAAYKAHSIFEDMQNLRKTADSATEVEKIIYREMLTYFDGNKYAAAAVVGNIWCETGSRPDNLQNIFNPYLDKEGNFNFENNGGATSRRLGWGDGVSDEDYTLGVTYGAYVGKKYRSPIVTIGGKSLPLNSTRNRFACDEAGYGLCQWTFYSRKAGLYDFAQEYAKENNEYFSGYADISDPKMQVKYLQHELDTLPEYRSVAGLMRSADSVEAASDIWMTKFERPYDQSESAKEYRRQISREKLQAMRFVRQNVGDLEEMDGFYFNQIASGPCFACSLANMMKRYCYLSGDSGWADIVPGCVFDDGCSIYSKIVFSGRAGASWVAKDGSGTDISEWRSGWGVGIRSSYSIHGISFSISTGYNISASGLIELLENHPEGVVIYQSGHAKLITGYDSSAGDFTCVDPVQNYSYGCERRLSETWGWKEISGNNQYEYIPTIMPHKGN